MSWDDHSESWDEDPEGPSAEDRRRFSSDTIACPACGDRIHDESVSCPSCGHWIEEVDSAQSKSRSHPAIGVILAVAIAGGGLVWWLVRTFG